MERGSVKTDSESPRWATIIQYVLVYIIWFLFCAVSFWAIWMVRTILVSDILFGRVDPWQLRAIDRWSLWVMGVAWVVTVFLVEGYLRKGVEKGRLLFYTGRLFLIPVIVIALAYLIQAL